MQKRLPEITTALPGPQARKVLALDHEFVSPSYTRDYPLVICGTNAPAAAEHMALNPAQPEEVLGLAPATVQRK